MGRRLPTVNDAVAEAACCKPSVAPSRSRTSREGQAKLFKALGDETRLEIVEMLAATDGEICACEFEARFDLSQPTISHHLKVLREVGLITGERRGTWVYYTLVRERLRDLTAFHALVSR